MLINQAFHFSLYGQFINLYPVFFFFPKPLIPVIFHGSGLTLKKKRAKIVVYIHRFISLDIFIIYALHRSKVINIIPF